ncbi:hypothetical protein FB45DRAFT_1077283 [Roridomyces roridus]|uniref:Uncharacterized protein n=1 Tax=Roridomyces roridus TaxID=1738132 RepID=A0AAD7CJK4_9AGAR|nr:hypothetical protein FB45DRAFT_1077283 [Roridomyces roridus]
MRDKDRTGVPDQESDRIEKRGGTQKDQGGMHQEHLRTDITGQVDISPRSRSWPDDWDGSGIRTKEPELRFRMRTGIRKLDEVGTGRNIANICGFSTRTLHRTVQQYHATGSVAKAAVIGHGRPRNYYARLLRASQACTPLLNGGNGLAVRIRVGKIDSI